MANSTKGCGNVRYFSVGAYLHRRRSTSDSWRRSSGSGAVCHNLWDFSARVLANQQSGVADTLFFWHFEFGGFFWGLRLQASNASAIDSYHPTDADSSKCSQSRTFSRDVDCGSASKVLSCVCCGVNPAAVTSAGM